MSVAAAPWNFVNARVYVLVEDPLTAALLNGAWRQDVDIRVQSVGGGHVVEGLVTDAMARNHATVFGVVDRDFVVSSGWNPTGHLYRLERHEAENYLLDFTVLGHLAKEVPAKVNQEALGFVGCTTAWMAARATLWEMDRALKEKFPGTPQLPTSGQRYAVDHAVTHITSSRLLAHLQEGVKQHWTLPAL